MSLYGRGGLMAHGWTKADVARIAERQLKAPVKAKYHNETIVINGERFDSKREAQFYSELLLREKAREVRDIQRQVVFPLFGIVLADGLRPVEPVELIRVTEYRADFTFWEGARFVVADVKGAPRSPERYLLKKRWMQAQHGIQIVEIR